MDIRYENWTIVKKLGTGSFGSVYEIERKDFGVYKAALKVISIPQHADEINEIRSSGMSDKSISDYYSSMVEDIVKEFALMSKLKGMTNIVSYEDHQVIPHEEGIGWDIYIRMELLTPLDKYAQEHPLEENDIVRLGIGICRALERCQKLNIIHRDIKPGNIFVSEQGDFKLGDFGIARTVERTASNMSRKGTTNYMAPEVYNGMEYGRTVDIYSLGLVMYRLLNHNRTPFLPPFPEPIKYQDQEMALFKRINGTPLPYPNNEPTPLGDVILKACAYDSKDRFQSPASFRRALEKIAELSMEMTETSVPAPETKSAKQNLQTGQENVDADKQTGSAGSKAETGKKDSNKNHKKTGLLIAAIAAVVVVVLLIVLLPKGDSKQKAVVESTPEVITEEASTEADATAALFHVEDYTGRLANNVQKELTDSGLAVKTEETDGTEAEGTIIGQSVAAGTSLQEGEEITLQVSRGNQLILPEFYNKTWKSKKSTETVFAALQNDGLETGPSTEIIYDENVKPGKIVSIVRLTQQENTEEATEQELKAGDVVEKTAVLKVYLNGIRLPENIIGMPVEEAKKALTDAGFKVSDNYINAAYSDTVSYDCVLQVYNENGETAINADEIFKKGTSVALQLSLGVYVEPVTEATYYEPVYSEPATASPPPGDG